MQHTPTLASVEHPFDLRQTSVQHPPTRLKATQSNSSPKSRSQQSHHNHPHSTTVCFGTQCPPTLTSVEPPSDLRLTSVLPPTTRLDPIESIQSNPSSKTRPQNPGPNSPITITRIQQPSALERNVRPPSRPSNLLPTCV